MTPLFLILQFTHVLIILKEVLKNEKNNFFFFFFYTMIYNLSFLEKMIFSTIDKSIIIIYCYYYQFINLFIKFIIVNKK